MNKVTEQTKILIALGLIKGLGDKTLYNIAHSTDDILTITKEINLGGQKNIAMLK